MASEFPFEQLTLAAGKPLRVAVYGVIASAIRAGSLQPGDVLPNESDLAATWRVSRSVVREALLLLEEDGLVRTRRGRGRFVADELPPIGLEQLRPIEQVLGTTHEPIRIERTLFERQQISEFVGTGLALDDSATVWVTKSIVYRGPQPVAFSMECIPAGRDLADVHPSLARLVENGISSTSSVLMQFITVLENDLGPGLCEIGVGVAGTEDRADALQLPPQAPVLIMNQTVYLDGKPAYFAKHLISPESGHMAIVQSAQSF